MLLIKPYNRDRAVEYARRWALERNPLFENFAGIGGDCTNFVSQSVLAGGCVMDYTPTFGWYYLSPDDRAPAWTGVEYFFDYLTGQGDFAPPQTRIGPFGERVGDMRADVGDVVQLANAEGDFYHSLLITDFSGGDILVTAHTNDALDRPLSSYNYSARRIIHITGFRVEYPDDACFDALINAQSLPQM